MISESTSGPGGTNGSRDAAGDDELRDWATETPKPSGKSARA
eukprot:CAMPEP_0180246338 /NCGR_PEP_ID=MMETSP0987-20121128/35504_1 /TAXON_ID=697907 /ORGANISM="non described non described, Strain CCMP2293" /LENGTH=41 /DNA_ID= /DNA_START= /DNA_END= /DNA_ORIENTATION=